MLFASVLHLPNFAGIRKTAAAAAKGQLKRSAGFFFKKISKGELHQKLSEFEGVEMKSLSNI